MCQLNIIFFLSSDSESDDDFSEPSESEDEEFKVKKASKTKKGKVTNNVKTKQPPASKKEKPAPKPSKSKSQATGLFSKSKEDLTFGCDCELQLVCQQLPHLWEVLRQPNSHQKDPPCPPWPPHQDQHPLWAQQRAGYPSGLHQVQNDRMTQMNKKPLETAALHVG